jgi:hypothetical protein
VAICATDFALLDFCKDRGPTERSTHIGHVHAFVPQVVKLKYNRIGLAAVHARVQREVFPNSLLVFRKRHGGRRLNTSEVTLAIAQVPEPLVLGEAALAPRVTDAEGWIPESELVEGFFYAALCANLGFKERHRTHILTATIPKTSLGQEKFRAGLLQAYARRRDVQDHEPRSVYGRIDLEDERYDDGTSDRELGRPRV